MSGSINPNAALFKGFWQTRFAAYIARKGGADVTESPFDLLQPEWRDTAAIFSCPHSGRTYPRSFLRRSALDAWQIRSSEDAFVDDLFAAAPLNGAPLLVARAPRALVDLNRASDELDPSLIEGLRRSTHNPRVASGLGVIPRVVAGGQTIYRGKLSLDEARARIRDVWRPYHDTLQRLLGESRAAFGQAILIDCHSMPHEALEGTGAGGGRPEVVLGDRFGTAASAEVVDRIEAALAGAGLSVTRNAPFAGAYITRQYGRPARHQHVVQMEIDRALYMDEARIAPHEGFGALKAALSGAIAEIAAIGRPQMPLAAE